ncbi:MAG: hypothetical protein WCT14_17920, partial [Treponemataceae bacterium]
QENIDFYARDNAEFEFSLPWRGTINALIRGRIPFIPVHADNIAKYRGRISTFVLPNVGALSNDQCAALIDHAEQGGSIVASGRTGIFDTEGNPRRHETLEDFLGVRRRNCRHGITKPKLEEWETFDAQSYARIERDSDSGILSILAAGFEKTDILPFGGCLEVIDLLPDTSAFLTYVPPFPIYPPEFAWMRQPRTSLPAATFRIGRNGGKVVYFAGDFDRLYGRFNNPDHGTLLRNALAWAVGETFPVRVEGPGLIDINMYKQGKRLLLHLTNLNNEGAWRVPISEIVAAGPYVVEIPAGTSDAKYAYLTVSEKKVACFREKGMLRFVIESVRDHELAVIE